MRGETTPTAVTAETQSTQRKASFPGAIIIMALMDEHEFQKKSDAAFEALRKRLLEIGDENDFEVEGGSGKLEIEFEDEDETRFVISPNAPVRQIWISALTTSFKLGWSDAAQAFVQDKTGETLSQVMSRILTEKLGTAISV
jgi:iron donor protein CyaY